MERLLQIGDIANITGNGIRRKFAVTGFDENSIIVSDKDESHHLVGEGDNWSVQGWDTPHHIVFGHSGLSDVMDINRNILIDMYYEDILNVCIADVVVREICDDELFWQMKVEKDFGQLDSLRELMIPGIKYKDLYKKLVTNPATVITVGRIDMLERMNFHLTVRLINIAVQYGQLDTLKWLLKEYKLAGSLMINDKYIDISLGATAAQFGHLHILEWLVEQGLQLDPNFNYVTEIANEAAVFGQINVLEWLADKLIYPDIDDQALFEDIIVRGNISSLEWLEKHSVQYDSDIADIAIKEDRLPILKWLAKRNVYPSEEGFWIALSASVHGVTDNFNKAILEWFLEQHIFGTAFVQNAVDWLAGEGLLNVLKFFSERGILPTIEAVTRAKILGQDEVIEWLASKNIHPNN